MEISRAQIKQSDLPKDLAKHKYHIETYGCQMNVSDSEVVASILESIGYSYSDDINNSELVLLNTCSIREKAEQTVRKKLESINSIKKINKNLNVGVLA